MLISLKAKKINFPLHKGKFPDCLFFLRYHFPEIKLIRETIPHDIKTENFQWDLCVPLLRKRALQNRTSKNVKYCFCCRKIYLGGGETLYERRSPRELTVRSIWQNIVWAFVLKLATTSKAILLYQISFQQFWQSFLLYQTLRQNTRPFMCCVVNLENRSTIPSSK